MSEQDLGSYNLRLYHCDNFSSLCSVNFHFRLCHVQAGRMPRENPCPRALLVSFTACDFFDGIFLIHSAAQDTVWSLEHLSLVPSWAIHCHEHSGLHLHHWTIRLAVYLCGSPSQLIFLGGTTYCYIFCCEWRSPPQGEWSRNMAGSDVASLGTLYLP